MEDRRWKEVERNIAILLYRDNKISWNGTAPKYDIRDWSPEHEKMGKMVTHTERQISIGYALREHTF